MIYSHIQADKVISKTQILTTLDDNFNDAACISKNNSIFAILFKILFSGQWLFGNLAQHCYHTKTKRYFIF